MQAVRRLMRAAHGSRSRGVSLDFIAASLPGIGLAAKRASAGRSMTPDPMAMSARRSAAGPGAHSRPPPRTSPLSVPSDSGRINRSVRSPGKHLAAANQPIALRLQSWPLVGPVSDRGRWTSASQGDELLLRVGSGRTSGRPVVREWCGLAL